MYSSRHILMVALFAAAPTLALAMPDMAAMQQAMEEAQRCMASVDQDAVEALAEEAQAFEAELEALCAANRRDEAQREALAFATRVMNDPQAQKMQECAEMVREAMAGMPMMPMPDAGLDVPTPEEIEQSHVCDGMQ